MLSQMTAAPVREYDKAKAGIVGLSEVNRLGVMAGIPTSCFACCWVVSKPALNPDSCRGSAVRVWPWPDLLVTFDSVSAFKAADRMDLQVPEWQVCLTGDILHRIRQNDYDNLSLALRTCNSKCSGPNIATTNVPAASLPNSNSRLTIP